MNFSFCLTYATSSDEREVLAWGRCDYGQLGRDVAAALAGSPPQWDHVPTLVPSLSGVKQVWKSMLLIIST